MIFVKSYLLLSFSNFDFRRFCCRRFSNHVGVSVHSKPLSVACAGRFHHLNETGLCVAHSSTLTADCCAKVRDKKDWLSCHTAVVTAANGSDDQGCISTALSCIRRIPQSPPKRKIDCAFHGDKHTQIADRCHLAPPTKLPRKGGHQGPQNCRSCVSVWQPVVVLLDRRSSRCVSVVIHHQRKA